MDRDEYWSIIKNQKDANTRMNLMTDEESLVKAAKRSLELTEPMAEQGELKPRKSVELWNYYWTVRIPARAKAGGHWLLGVKHVMMGGTTDDGRKTPVAQSKVIHLDEKALKEFLEKSPQGIGEYRGSLDDSGLKKVNVTVVSGGLKCSSEPLHGVYRYVLAPGIGSSPRLYAYEEGDNTWKHSQFLGGCANIVCWNAPCV